MIINKIDTLKKYRAIIILGEIGALLHDLGKLDGRFLKKHRKDLKEDKDYEHEKIIDYDKGSLSNLGLLELFTTPLSNLVAPFIPATDQILKAWNLDSVTLKDIIEKHSDGKIKMNEKLLGFVKLADRKDSADDRLMPLAQQKGKTCLASTFGIEIDVNEDELEKLRNNFYFKLAGVWRHVGTKLSSNTFLFSFRDSILIEWEYTSNSTPAETRRAANDVTLWDHSYATASIAKALMIEDILNNFSTSLPSNASRHWTKKLRILGVAWDSFKIYKEAQTLSGIAGRDLLIEAIRKRVKTLLEFEIPVGNAIYEDQNFVCFLVPENLDLIFEEIKKMLITEVMELSNGSIVPCIELSDLSPYPSKIIVQTLDKLQTKIKAPLLLEGSLDKIGWIKEWRGVKNREICVECGKRPRMKGKDICEWCQGLRIEGAKASAKKQNGVFEETVWIDEIADESGNVALIYGFIPLERWLDGTLLKTLLIKSVGDVIDPNREVGRDKVKIWERPEYRSIREDIEKGGFPKIKEMLSEFLYQINKEGYEKAKQELLRPFLADELPLKIRSMIEDIYLSLRSRIGSDRPKDWAAGLFAKPSSPSRLSRIWRETLDFANELVNEARNVVKEFTGGYCLRMKIEPEFMDGETRKFFEDKRNKYQPYELVELDFDIPLPKTDLYWDGEHFNTTLRIENYVTAHQAEGLQQILKEKQEKIRAASKKLINSILKIKIKDSGKDKIIEIKIRKVDFEEYLPFRKIMVSPNRLKILVPANLALKIIHGFLNKYNDRFSKVRGRLSFNLGIAFFKRKFPLFAVMDGVERSIESLSSELNREDGWRRFKVIDDSEIKVVEIGNDVKEKVSTEFGSWTNVYRWNVYRKLGDDSEDLYHPNFIVTNASGDEETYFEIILKEKDVAIVNVKDLDGKIIEIVPNLFDFQFFDSTTRRFDLALPRKHELLGESSPRPYLLEDVEKIIELWNVLNERLTRTQIKKLEYVCANKIKKWELKGKNLAEDSEFKEFTVSSVENICGRLSEGDKRIIISSILSGMFFDVIELFMTLKSEIGGEQYG